MVLPLVFTPIGALFGGVGTVIFTIGVRKLRRRRRLEREGVLTDGEVTEIAERNISINRVRQCTIYYTFQDFQGQTQKGDSGLVPPWEAATWKRGDRCKVRYDSARPQENIFMGREDTGPPTPPPDPFSSR